MAGGAGVSAKPNDLVPRIGSSIVLAVGALASAWWGGVPFKLVWIVLSAIVLQEWMAIITDVRPQASLSNRLSLIVLLASFLGPVLVMIIMDRPAEARFVAAAAGLAVAASLGFAALHGARAARWAVGGCLYATLLLASMMMLRLGDGGEQAQRFGFIAILFLFSVVWGADIGAYFAGRAIGGPKLAPRISPNKTWSGFAGGILASVTLALLLLSAFGVPVRPMHAVIAGVLALASVAGDLFESFLKRRFGVKDSGKLIPGHGGFMDRLDGFIFAAALAAMIGVCRGGFEAAGTGLLAGW